MIFISWLSFTLCSLTQSSNQNKVQWLAACGHVSASSQSLRFILSLRMNSRVRKQPIIALYFESENELKFYNIEACSKSELLCNNSLFWGQL